MLMPISVLIVGLYESVRQINVKTAVYTQVNVEWHIENCKNHKKGDIIQQHIDI